MSKRDTHRLLEDMLEACLRVMRYTDKINYDQFLTDEKTVDAVVRNIQILGEAAGQIPAATRQLYPEIEWTKIIRSRHILVHEYFELDYEIIWRITIEYIPPLKDQLNVILKGD